MSIHSKSVRAEIQYRAGTRLDWKTSKTIHYTPPTNAKYPHPQEQKHGVLDYAQRVYQGGGELGQLANMYYKPPLISELLEVWEHIAKYALRWEKIDHEPNDVYEMDVHTACKIGRLYTATDYYGNRVERWGVDIYQFTRRDSAGRELPPPTELELQEAHAAWLSRRTKEHEAKIRQSK